MGSSPPESEWYWVAITVICGLLYLIFDAARYFAQQLGMVRLRRLTGDPLVEKHGRWTRYDAENFHLVSGALLQVALVIAVGSTAMLLQGDLTFGRAVFASVGIWAAIVLVWKFILALVPDDAAEISLRFLIPVSHFFYFLFFPVLYPLRSLVARFERETEDPSENGQVSDEEVQAFIDVGEEEGILEESEGRLLQQIVDFGDRLARELMTPRIDMVAFDAKRPVAELAKLFSESKYSRIPIYTSSIDQITGIVHVKDILDILLKGDQRPAGEIARPPYFVPETKKVSELLREFQSEHLQVAVVVDEFGGTAGIITIEDIVEEIVGDISDEHEDDEMTPVDLGGGEFLVSGLMRVDTLEEILETDLKSDDYETVAGLIFTTLGRVPKPGTFVAKGGYRFVVERADRRRIYRVRVMKDPEAVEEEVDGEEAAD
jgi:CBS domain containing-hemolysin-like protein